MKQLIIAEKREVGVAIANALGVHGTHEGYIEDEKKDYIVSWAAGHLIEKTYPCDDLPWDAAHLPIIPDSFELRPRTTGSGKDRRSDPRAVSQLRILRDLAKRCDVVINAGDAGREGEVIQRYIYEYIGVNKPIKRLWVSSMEPKEILAAFAQLRPSSDYDNLYAAGDARTEADWLVGINATRALSAAVAASGRRTSGVYSLGRVQTPTLALVCRRFIENRDFVKSPFWKLRVNTASDGKAFYVDEDERHEKQDEALALKGEVEAAGVLTVKSYSSKEADENAPDLHDITSMEVEGIRRLGLTAGQVDEILESLYMKRLTTYPRTGSQFVTEEVYYKFPELLENIHLHGDEPLRDYLDRNPIKTPSRRCVKPEKVTDHHAIIITGTDPTGVQLTDAERAVYNLVCIRMLETLGRPCHVKKDKAVLACGEHTFSASGRTVLLEGWRGVRAAYGAQKAEDDETGQDEQKLPVLREGDTLPVEGVEIKEGETKPKPLYSEDTLLQTMQNISREMDDAQMKETLKEIGLGTPATRRSIIETLLGRNYIERKGKKIVPTETGLSVYMTVKDMRIASPELTGRWESFLNDIAEGRRDDAEFRKRTREFAANVTKEILDSEAVKEIKTREESAGCKCPRCGGTVRIWPTNAKCKGCGLILWREICHKTLSESTMKKLLEEGRCGTVKGLTSKSGKSFDAKLRLVLPKEGSEKPDTCTLEFVFDEGPKKTNFKKKGNGKSHKH